MLYKCHCSDLCERVVAGLCGSMWRAPLERAGVRGSSVGASLPSATPLTAVCMYQRASSRSAGSPRPRGGHPAVSVTTTAMRNSGGVGTHAASSRIMSFSESRRACLRDGGAEL